MSGPGTLNTKLSPELWAVGSHIGCVSKKELQPEQCVGGELMVGLLGRLVLVLGSALRLQTWGMDSILRIRSLGEEKASS